MHGSAPSEPAARTLYEATLDRLRVGLPALEDKPEETPEATLCALWHLAGGRRVSAAAAIGSALPRLDDAARAALDELVARRLAGVPLAHLTGRQRFMGLEMLAGPAALIPRRETELLVRAALDRLPSDGAPRLALDGCTGSGNVAAAIAAARPAAEVHASDLSDEAVAFARENLRHLGLASRVGVVAGDLLDAFTLAGFAGRADLVTCNPPYISTPRRLAMPAEIAGHEPSIAFDGGALGVSILYRLIREAPALLRAGGWLVFEVGAGQGPAVARRLGANAAWDLVDPVADARGTVRVLAARRSASAPAG